VFKGLINRGEENGVPHSTVRRGLFS